MPTGNSVDGASPLFGHRPRRAGRRRAPIALGVQALGVPVGVRAARDCCGYERHVVRADGPDERPGCVPRVDDRRRGSSPWVYHLAWYTDAMPDDLVAARGTGRPDARSGTGWSPDRRAICAGSGPSPRSRQVRAATPGQRREDAAKASGSWATPLHVLECTIDVGEEVPHSGSRFSDHVDTRPRPLSMANSASPRASSSGEDLAGHVVLADHRGGPDRAHLGVVSVHAGPW